MNHINVIRRYLKSKERADGVKKYTAHIEVTINGTSAVRKCNIVNSVYHPDSYSLRNESSGYSGFFSTAEFSSEKAAKKAIDDAIKDEEKNIEKAAKEKIVNESIIEL